MGPPTEKWGEPPSTGIMLCQNSTQEVLQTEPINNNMEKGNFNIMHVEDTILAIAADSGINKNWCLLDNQLTCNSFINGKYLSNIRDSTNGKYPCVHCNKGVTHTKKNWLPPWILQSCLV